jgi:hypothetical protein
MRFNKMPLIAAGALILIVATGVLVCGGKKKSKSAKSPPVSARALVVPGNRPRTVVVPPCNTPVSSTAGNAARGQPTPGATTVEVPGGGGVHTLLVPNCQATKTGSTTADGGIPSAVFVLGTRKRLSKDKEGKIESDGVVANSVLLLPNGSSTSTIVVKPCTKKPAGKGNDSVLKGSSELAVAPAC